MCLWSRAHPRHVAVGSSHALRQFLRAHPQFTRQLPYLAARPLHHLALPVNDTLSGSCNTNWPSSHLRFRFNS